MLHCTIALLLCSDGTSKPIRTGLSKRHTERRNGPKKDEARDIMNLIRNYRNWRRYRETVTELSRLSNRELTDLGISRSDIYSVARKSL